MQKFLGMIFISTGVFGMAAYPAGGALINTENKTAMLFGFFMIIIGAIIIYSDRKKNGRR